MKRFLLILSLLVTISCFGQGKIDSLVQIGIQYHRDGEYKKAIEVYNEALKIDPKSPLVNYELARTYMYSGDNEKTIKYSDIVIKQKKDYLLDAYNAKGSALDNMGKTKESIELFKKAIKEYGDNYLLWYNLGVNYFKIQDDKNAESAFINAIRNNPSHASSHFLLAQTEKEQNQRVQSLLSLYYFLLLEPSSERSKIAYKLLKEQFSGNVQKDKNDPKKITIFMNPQKMESDEFAGVEFMLGIYESLNLSAENKDKTPDELFINNTKSFFTSLGELREKEEREGIWWNFYVPAFYSLAKSDYMDVFCYYISMSSNENARKWLKENSKKVEDFGKWMSEK